MNVTDHHAAEELQTLYRIDTLRARLAEKNARLARRIQGVYLASKGLTCSQIIPDNPLNCLAKPSGNFVNVLKQDRLKKMTFRRLMGLQSGGFWNVSLAFYIQGRGQGWLSYIEKVVDSRQCYYCAFAAVFT